MQRDLIRLADKAQPGFEAILLAWWELMRPSLNATTDAIETGLVERVVALLTDTPDSEKLIGALTDIGLAVSELVFMLDNPAVERWARSHVGELVTQVTTETRQAIRDIVVDGFRTGKAPRAQARLIRETVGLTRRDAAAISRYRAGLEEAGTSPSRIEELTAKRSKKYLARRAENIARTESMTAANRGQLEAWKQMQDAGLLPPDTRTEWIAEPSSPRTCPICLALDGQTILLGGSYYLDAEASKVGPNGEVLETKPIRPITTQTPPAHPQCRCTTGIV